MQRLFTQLDALCCPTPRTHHPHDIRKHRKPRVHRPPALDEILKRGEKTWLELKAPDVVIRESTMDEKHHNAGSDFIYKVFDALDGANVRPSNISFTNGHGIGPDFDWTKANTDILSSIQSSIFPYAVHHLRIKSHPTSTASSVPSRNTQRISNPSIFTLATMPYHVSRQWIMA